MVESKLDKPLKKFLTKNIVKKELQDELAVADKTLGGVIKSKLSIKVRRHLVDSLCCHDSELKRVELSSRHATRESHFVSFAVCERGKDT